MSLPLLLSVPHAGRRVPPEAQPYCVLTPEEILHDGDGGAREVYALEDHVRRHVTTDVARAIVDMNRAPDDIRRDGVVKTHTCWDVPVYRQPLPQHVVAALIDRYHAPYHARLRAAQDVIAGVDCHTMAAIAPPEAPDPGRRRPRVCISDAHGTLPRPWWEALAGALHDSFGFPPSRNDPFQGGYIIREHSKRLPWVQIELSREPWCDLRQKREMVLRALQAWVRSITGSGIGGSEPTTRPT